MKKTKGETDRFGRLKRFPAWHTANTATQYFKKIGFVTWNLVSVAGAWMVWGGERGGGGEKQLYGIFVFFVFKMYADLC